MSRIYRHPTKPTVEIPQLDLLTFLFDSEYSFAQDDTLVLHADAADPSNRVTKATLRSLTQRIAHGLRTHFDIGARGPNTDIVTVISGGQVLVPAAFFGIIAAGGVYSAASPSSTPADLARQLVIADRAHAGVAREAAAQCGLDADRVVLVLDSSPGRWSLKSVDRSMDALSDQTLEWERVTDPKALEESLITILWSSGTTGLPKGVRLSHLNLVAETYITALSGRDWLVAQPHRGPVRVHGWADVQRGDRLLAAALQLGGPAAVRGAPRDHRVLHGPEHLLRITKDPRRSEGFQVCRTGEYRRGANGRRAAANREREVGRGGKGAPKRRARVTAMPRGDADADADGSLSSVLPGVELRIVDEEMRDVEEGEEGELLVRSVLAFWDGWFLHGRCGSGQGGRFYLVDRKKAAVIGVPAPDDPGNDLPRAYVVVDDRGKVTAEEIAEYVRARVAPYKQLRGGVVFVDEIPKNAVGKFLRRDLRERAKREMRETGAKL
ncbi:hypothetical protein B0H14DRAFT_2700839 [Mycena olivaceomarginata]|nr:hypothetical protein B0H14DRAFT_2700839 [Mycena olivaceomarginata]